MIEQYPHPKKEEIKPSEEEIEETARMMAIGWIIENVVRKGKNPPPLLDYSVLWDKESKEKLYERVEKIAREEAEKIANDESQTEEVRERAREFLEKGSQKKENKKEEK